MRRPHGALAQESPPEPAQRLDSHRSGLDAAAADAITARSHALREKQLRHGALHPIRIVERRLEKLATLGKDLNTLTAHRMNTRAEQLKRMENLIRTLGPESAFRRGFSITLGEDGGILRYHRIGLARPNHPHPPHRRRTRLHSPALRKMPVPAQEFPLAITVLACVATAILLVIMMLLLRINSRLAALSGSPSRQPRSPKPEEADPVEVGPGTPFDEFLREDPARLALTEKRAVHGLPAMAHRKRPELVRQD